MIMKYTSSNLLSAFVFVLMYLPGSGEMQLEFWIELASVQSAADKSSKWG